ncbi:MAG TPA: branched-chain amino acid ABC transporter permease [Hyphomicrobiales bacterium]|nr:branched-chain amino acid ABC transporter permease [Hyphomicrobiales bacterium]
MVEFLQQILSGLATGCVYALVALGLVLLYKATEVLSFAHGDLMMLAAFIAYTIVMVWGGNFVVGLLVAMIVLALLGLVINRFIIRPMMGRPIFAFVLVTLGVSLVLRGIVMLVPIWGTDDYRLVTPLDGKVLHLGPFLLNAVSAAVIVITGLVMAVFFLFFRYTKLGTAMRATAQNALAATYVGIDTRRIYAIIWAISAAAAALAGVLLAPMLFVHVNMGIVGLNALPAAIIGGVASLPGAVVGGILLGVVEALAGYYLPEGAKEVAPYVMLLVVLAIRPGGIFPEVVAKKV